MRDCERGAVTNGPLRVAVLNARDLTPAQTAAWSGIQAGNPELESPFFCPEFTRAVAAATENTFVGVLTGDDGTAAGFFPFRLERPGFGRNLDMCDFQGVIAPRGLAVAATEVVRGCGLNVWEFDHLLPVHSSFQRFCLYTSESPLIDLAGGWEAYQKSLSPEGKRHLAKAATSARKVERELGPLKLVEDRSDPALMQSMHLWRAQKYGPLPAWAHQALEHTRTARSPGFMGTLSALYAGEKLLAVHFGIRSRAVLHWWFPAYNPDLASYAPGILLLLRMAERAPVLGISRIDLGKGMQDYKRRFGNSSRPVATGSVELLSWSNVPRIVRRNCVRCVRTTPGLLSLARRVKRIFQPASLAGQ